jgi:hypothetical protein
MKVVLWMLAASTLVAAAMSEWAFGGPDHRLHYRFDARGNSIIPTQGGCWLNLVAGELWEYCNSAVLRWSLVRESTVKPVGKPDAEIGTSGLMSGLC